MLNKFIKFAITGGLGTVTNLILFFIFADKLHVYPSLVSVACFFISCTQNYIINHIWTFKIENNNSKPSLKLWLRFIIGSIFGLIINIIVLNLLLKIFNWPYYVIPQAIGIFAGMIINFTSSNYFVFKTKENL